MEWPILDTLGLLIFWAFAMVAGPPLLWLALTAATFFWIKDAWHARG